MKNTKVSITEFKTLTEAMFGTNVVSRKQMAEVSSKNSVSIPQEVYNVKVARGVFELGGAKVAPVAVAMPEMPKVKGTARVAQTVGSSVSYIPSVNPNFIKWGTFKDVTKVFKSKLFYPMFMTGMSGNGKTLGITQAAAQLKREIIRVNFTVETDEDDLLGGFRLIDGDTVWQDGPVVEAMKRGAILLLDEIDLASHKVMAIQSVLEGEGVFLKKIGEMVKPAPGFTIVATANTKGKGSDDGRFIGTNVLNEAFLDRFSATFYQPYPTPAVEKRILTMYGASVGVEDDTFFDNLTVWGDIIRKTFDEGGVDEVVSTRRLVDIIKSFSIFGSKERAIQLGIERFDEDTKESFMNLYSKIDAEVVPGGTAVEVEKDEEFEEATL